MAANVFGSIGIDTSFSQAFASNTVPGAANTPANNRVSTTCTFANGTGADKIDLKHSYIYPLTTTPTDLDLTSLTDIFGGAVNFARVRSITFRPQDTTDGHYFTAQPGPSNGWTGFMGAGSVLTFQVSSAANSANFVVTAPNTTGMAVGGSSKILRLTGSTSMNVEVEITGVHS